MLRCFRDTENNALQIFHHVVAGETKDAVAARLEPRISSLVMQNSLSKIVALAVDLSDELARMRDKIGDVIADRHLSTKVETRQAVGFQVPPQQRLRARHRTAELLGATALDVAHLGVRHAPLPTLPRKGGGSLTAVLTSLSTITITLAA
ncbi:hypothetical protein ACVW1C_003158 [Bradyrhizobium sp. USDA 4011]